MFGNIDELPIISIAQISLNVLMGLVEYLEVLNIYNCERWACSGLPALVLAFTAVNFALRRDGISVPSLMTHSVGFLGALFWDITYWNISTRHRTEYYDTHDFYCGNLWVLNFWTAVYVVYVVKKDRVLPM